MQTREEAEEAAAKMRMALAEVGHGVVIHVVEVVNDVERDGPWGVDIWGIPPEIAWQVGRVVATSLAPQSRAPTSRSKQGAVTTRCCIQQARQGIERPTTRAEPDLIEQRSDRSYDEANASTLFLPNGTLCCSYDRSFLGAAGREVLDAYVAEERL